MDLTTKKKLDRRVVIVSNRLPISVGKKHNRLEITPSVGGLATGLSSFHQGNNGLWVGWPGFSPPDQKEENVLESNLKENYNCSPVYIKATDLKKYYYGFSNKTIWPLFHYFTATTSYDASDWEGYKRVNENFCRKVLEVATEDDIIWIHDYQLLLLPQLIREQIPEATIGFFLHIPFPSMEIFRSLPWREEILRGMLGADLIGFHAYDYSRHFLSCVLRILGEEHEYGRILTGNRTVRVDTFPMGIDADKFLEAAKSNKVAKRAKALRNTINTEKIMLSVDRLDFTKGLINRVKAYELFLEKNPQWQQKISFVMLCVPSRTQVREYQLLKKDLDEVVGRINGRFSTPGWTPIIYMYRSLPFDQLVALYVISDLGVVTPIRDGMNLVAKEYLICQENSKKGVLILSETAGAAAELGEAILVNPNDLNQMAYAIAEALSMQKREKDQAIEVMTNRIKKYHVFRWAEDFVEQLLETKTEQRRKKSRLLSATLRTELLEEYKKATSRLFLLDYDGTLVSLQKKPELARPDSELISLLSALTAEPKNAVVVISGRDRNFLEQWLQKTRVNFVAEHGAWVGGAGEKWEFFSKGITTEWKRQIRPILEMFTERTPGSFIEEKDYSLVWHYRKSHPELGSLRAKELMDDLRDLLTGTTLQLLQGSKVLEVKPQDINKGRAALHWLERQDWEFVMAIGDDWTDEEMFSVLPRDAWSINVGLDHFSKADYFLESPKQVRALFSLLLDA
jgi:trehalose 6-phosphate synthase/phosphatase